MGINWAIFSVTGYLSVLLWLTMPLLWLLHQWWRPRRWLVHIALIVGIVAYGLAIFNSENYVNRIQVDRSEDIANQMSRQEMARKAAEEQRSEDVANIRFAEDASGDYLDIAGLDQEDMKYFESFTESEDGEEPAWRQNKVERTTDSDDEEDSGGGLESDALPDTEPVKPILMSDADKVFADKVDGMNIMLIEYLLIIALVFILFDYVRRLNVDNEVYFPLPLPSSWADALTPREAITKHDESSPRSIEDQMRLIVRRGETFIYMTDRPKACDAIEPEMNRLPGDMMSLPVVSIDDNPKLTDDFIFETLWYGRDAFKLSDTQRSSTLMQFILDRLEERRDTRAHTRQGVHILWDQAEPPTPQTLARFAKLGQATGVMLTVCEG